MNCLSHLHHISPNFPSNLFPTKFTIISVELYLDCTLVTHVKTPELLNDRLIQLDITLLMIQSIAMDFEKQTWSWRLNNRFILLIIQTELSDFLEITNYKCFSFNCAFSMIMLTVSFCLINNLFEHETVIYQSFFRRLNICSNTNLDRILFGNSHYGSL